MTRIELYDFLKTCPNQDWFIAGDDNNGIRVYFPVDDEVEEWKINLKSHLVKV